jgi:hypothetical protein
MKKSNLLMLIVTLLLVPLFFLPMWNITLEAPQYPIPLGMNIHINKIVDANPFDVKNINLMNHYVGMKNIPSHLKEFDVFPPVIIGMIILGLLIGWKGNWKWFLGWFLLLTILGIAGMYDFYLWEYDYGHTLNPKAIIKFTNPDGSPLAYQPPLFGSKKILNFNAHSYPRSGALLMFLGMILVMMSVVVGYKESSPRQH